MTIGIPSSCGIGCDSMMLRAYGQIGTETTINSGDMAGILMIAVQALEKRTAGLKEEVKTLKAENADLKARLERLERMIGVFAMTAKAE